MLPELFFTSRVMGKAIERLKAGKVRQTIRSAKHASQFLGMEGETVMVTLDGRYLYNATIKSISKGETARLTREDAEAGGFESLKELKAAAARAGFRFQRNYEVFKIRFRSQLVA